MDHPVLVWIRNGDFRVHDNPALSYAAQRGCPVLAIYIHDPLHKGPSTLGGASSAWLEKGLEQWESLIQSHGFGWCIRKGNPLEILQHIIKETRAIGLYWNRRYAPDEIEIDAEVKEVIQAEGVPVQSFPGNVLIEPFRLHTVHRKPYQTFNHFWKDFSSAILDTTETPFCLPQKRCPHSIDSLSVAELELTARHLNWPQRVMSHWEVGEDHATKQLDQFIHSSINDYASKRDILGKNTTSKLSPYLHFGNISVRTVWNRIMGHSDMESIFATPSGREHFLRELGWREFAIYLLYHFPHMYKTPLRKEYELFPFRKDEEELIAWQKGKTGIPIVDAGMRQLWQTGWMHNRVRMIVGSYLVKHMLHSWKEGRDWFWDTLVDADLANNSLGWQWIAGCGVDAAPYFRIFNPVLQGEKFDPDGAYIRAYVPQLSQIPKEYIHKPWLASPQQLCSWGVELGTTYPKPIVELSFGRQRALKAFSSLTKS